MSAPDMRAAVAVLKQGRERYAGMYVPSSHLAWFFGEIDRAIAILEATPQLLALVRAADAVTDEYTWREGVLVAVEALPPEVRKMVERAEPTPAVELLATAFSSSGSTAEEAVHEVECAREREPIAHTIAILEAAPQLFAVVRAVEARRAAGALADAATDPFEAAKAWKASVERAKAIVTAAEHWHAVTTAPAASLVDVANAEQALAKAVRG